MEHGVNPDKECVPVTPAQHYFMGGIKVDHQSKTTMNHLYAVGETACNGVHGRNRLASNSLLESMVFAKRAAREITDSYTILNTPEDLKYINIEMYENRDTIAQNYRELVLDEIHNA